MVNQFREKRASCANNDLQNKPMEKVITKKEDLK